MSAQQNTALSGDVSIGRDATIGGDATIQGSATIMHDLTVLGTINADNVGKSYQGTFDTLASLQVSVLSPKDGMWALVGDTLYIYSNGQWVAISGSGSGSGSDSGSGSGGGTSSSKNPYYKGLYSTYENLVAAYPGARTSDGWLALVGTRASAVVYVANSGVWVCASSSSGSGSGSGGSGSTGGSVEYADRAGEADHATNADYATTAGKADGLSDTAAGQFLSAVNQDEAEEEIAFKKGVKFGTDAHSSTYGIDGNGKTVLSTITADRVKSDTAEEFLRVLLGGKGYDLFVSKATGRSTLWVDQLFVRVKAYFASLEIRKISYSGGTTLFSNAGSTLAKVVPIYASGDTEQSTPVAWKCYAVADDGTTRTMNWWKVGDQALCQTFNAKVGVSTDVSSTYYWRLVTEVGQEELEETTVSNDNGTSTRKRTFDYVVLSNKDAFLGDVNDDETKIVESSSGTTTFIGHDMQVDCSEPQVGDVIVQAGSQAQPSKRGNAIILQTSSDDQMLTKGIDDTTPSIRMYHGVGSFQWTGLTCIISPEKVKFRTGYFEVFTADDGTDACPTIHYVGTWQSDRAYGYYEQVTWNGSLWTWLNAEKNSEMGVEPSEASGWTATALKGEAESAVSIDTDYSAVALAKSNADQSVTVTAKVYKGTTALTAGTDFTLATYSCSLGTLAEPSTDSGIAFKITIPKGTYGAGQLKFTVTIDGTNYDKVVPIVVAKDGDNGTSVTIKGSLDSMNDLDATGAENGDGYLIDGYLWVYTGTVQEDDTHHNGFENVGRIQGENGQTTFLHLAYCNTSDNSDGSFSTTFFTGALYIGVYVDTTEEDSQTFGDYQWTRLRGEDGVAHVYEISTNSASAIINANGAGIISNHSSVTGLPTTVSLLDNGVALPISQWTIDSCQVSFYNNTTKKTNSATLKASSSQGQIQAVNDGLVPDFTYGATSDESASITWSVATLLTSSWTASAGTITLTIAFTDAEGNARTATMGIAVGLTKMGSNGESAYTFDSSNEMDCIGCDSDGVVQQNTLIYTDVTLYEGASAVSIRESDVTAEALVSADDYQITAMNSDRLGNCTIVQVAWSIPAGTKLDKDHYTATITLETDGETYTTVFTLAVVKAGKPGESPALYRLRPSMSAIAFTYSTSLGYYTPTVQYLGCGYTKTTADDIVIGDSADQNLSNCYLIDGKYSIFYRRVYANGNVSAWTFLKQNSYSALAYSVEVYPVSSYSAIDLCLSSATATGSVATSNIIDMERIPVVLGGEKGETGDATAEWNVEVSPQPLMLTDSDFSTSSDTPSLSSTKSASLTVTYGGQAAKNLTVQNIRPTRCTLDTSNPTSVSGNILTVNIASITTHTVKSSASNSPASYNVPYASAYVNVTFNATNAEGTSKSLTAQILIQVDYTGHYAKLLTTTDSISSTVGELQTKEGVLEEQVSQIKLTAGNISLTVAKSQVRRNLLQGTAFRRALDGWQWNGTVQQIRVSEAYLGCNALRLLGKTGYSNGLCWNNMALKSGKKYVLSFMYKVTQADWTAYGGSSSKQIAISAILWRQSAQTNILSFTNQTITASDVGTWKTAKFVTASEVSGSYTDWDCVIYVDGSYNGAAVHICRPILEEGEESYGWGLSEADADYIGGNLLDNTDTLAVGGNLTMVNTSYSTVEDDSETGVKRIHATPTALATSSEVNLLRWNSSDLMTSGGFAVARGKELMFSFEAKGSGTARATFYRGSGDMAFATETEANGLISGTSGYGTVSFAVDSQWRRYWVHWTVSTDVSLSLPQYLFLKCLGGGDVYLRRPKLEAGALMTAWTAGSEGAENVDNVYEALLPTGIDISHKKIRVTADQFEIYNNSGEATASVDKNGNLEVNSGLFRGFVMMKPTIITPDNITGYLSSFQPANGYTNLDFSKTGSFVVFTGAISDWTKANLNGNEIQIILPNYGGSLTVGATSSIYDCLPYIGCRFILVNATSAGSYGYATININGGTSLTSPLASGKNAVGNGYMAVAECSFRYSTTSPGVVWSGYNVPHGLSSIPTTQSDEDAEISVASEEADGTDLSEASEEGKS